ncbi:uncharacterized protein LOC131429348 [Malaya genurostris]|uniref:uncharacterized protein LOC131429348 n=1 Tax=Malaya genurostris TaxID=325434 RepID=UPI0026F40860|nr:uncharacterized protein LOC131429348 [Malaya genurostris]
MYRDKDGSLFTDGREVIKRWKQHFDEHLNSAENVGIGVQDDGRNDYVSAAEDGNDPAPALREVNDAMHQLKIDKLPEEWKEGVICPIHKKGDHLECEDFRAITVLNAAYKVLPQIIFRRLSPKTNEFVGSYQAGFVDGRSTTDQIFTVRKILQKCREYQVPTHHLFIDFKAAYDSIDRIELWKIMDKNSFPGNSIGSRRGLRHGGGLSCLLFNIALEGVMRRAGPNSRGTIFTKSSQSVCFADDMDIIARNFGTVAELYTRLKREAAKVGLVVNASKTKYMLVGGTEHDRIRLGSSVTIDGDTFEVVEEFVYLGSLLTADNNIHLHTKCTMYKTLIRPMILYGHEAWIMLEEELQALDAFERRVLRTIFGGVQKNGVWRRKMNHELAALYGEPSIQKVAKAGRIK